MRSKTGFVRHRKHKKVLDAVKGSRLSRGKHYKVAKEQLLHAGQYAFEGRKNRKRDFRKLWIQRINAGLSQIDQGPSYSVFTKLLINKKVSLNRKMLAALTVEDPDAFNALVAFVYGK